MSSLSLSVIVPHDAQEAVRLWLIALLCVYLAHNSLIDDVVSVVRVGVVGVLNVSILSGVVVRSGRER